MGPAIRDGDLVTFAPIRHRQVRRGDVLLYDSARGPTAHRVVECPKRDRAIFLTRGDAPGSPLEEVPVGQVLGRVESVERDGRPVRVRRWFARQVAAADWLRRWAARRLRARKGRQSAGLLPMADAGKSGFRRDASRSGRKPLIPNEVDFGPPPGTALAIPHPVLGALDRVATADHLGEWQAETLSRGLR